MSPIGSALVDLAGPGAAKNAHRHRLRDSNTGRFEQLEARGLRASVDFLAAWKEQGLPAPKDTDAVAAAVAAVLSSKTSAGFSPPVRAAAARMAKIRADYLRARRDAKKPPRLDMRKGRRR